ncbi:MAG: retron Ec67 family RNA-directed DNA polymerase/endonuclease [Lysobacteraceae bacterium]
MSELAKFKALKSLQDVANYLGYKPNRVAYLIRILPPAERYTTFKIPKRSGGDRTICAPRPELKNLQRRLAEKLQDCLQEIEKSRHVKQPVAHGFKRNYSIMTNGYAHRRRKFVFNMDISDFFGSLNFGRVRGFLMRNSDFKMDPAAATVIAQIACHDNSLPQGSPCSPVLSNLIANALDMRLKALARREGCSYSRYADDLTFSTSKTPFPEGIAVASPNDLNRWEPATALIKILTKQGFKENPEKTRMQYFNSRQEVTGLVVNKRINTDAKYRRNTRAMVHRLLMTGTFELKSATATNPTRPAKPAATIAQLEGRLAHAISVDRAWTRLAKLDEPEELTANEKLLRDLVFYRDFAASQLPTLLFEGKTDRIYIRCAVRRLAPVFASLTSGPSGATKLALKLHAFNKNASRLFKLSGGTGDFKKFLEDYRKNYWAVKAPKGINPVIMILDNDSGAAPILNFIKSYFKISPPPGTLSFHVVENLYIVLTSPIGSTHSCIEDLFDTATLATKLNGKSFNKSNSVNPASEYGKAVFSEAVIKKNQASINFDGFKPMLLEIETILSKHSAKLPTSPLSSSGISTPALGEHK